MTDSVVICIPICKQPKRLQRLLDAIAVQQTNAVISVLVADSDPEGRAGFSLCLAMEDYPWPLTAVVAPHRGQVRNVLIEYALMTGASFIAMIDDDTWPQTDWLDQFLACARATHADLLQGPILFGLDRKTNGPGDIRRPTGPIDMPQAARNLLMRRAMLEGMTAPWFDPHLALTGGEDRDFFVRLRQAGRRFAWCDEARLHGDCPETRNRPGLLLQTLFRATGKLSAMAGRRDSAYAVIHGE